MERWEFLVQGLALLAVVVQTSRVQEDAVDQAKYNHLMKKIQESSIPKTEEDNKQIQKMAVAVFQNSDEADAPYTLLKTKFDPSPLGLNTPNPDYKPYVRDLKRDILKKELKMDKAELKGELALQVSRML